MNKPIWFEKGKYYIHTEKIDAYYDVNEGKFFSVKTGKPYKGVISGFATLVDHCKNDSYYDNNKFQFSPKELIFIATCSNCCPISTMTDKITKQILINHDKNLSALALPKELVYTGREISLIAKVLWKWKISPSSLLCGKNTIQKRRKTLTLLFFQTIFVIG